MSCLGFLPILAKKQGTPLTANVQQICVVNNEHRRITQPHTKNVSIKVFTNPLQSWFAQDSLLLFCFFFFFLVGSLAVGIVTKNK